MTVYTSRDYSPATSGYIVQPFGGSWATTETGRTFVGTMYHLSLFLTKILGFTTVGQTSWNIDNTNIKSLAISAATNTVPIQVTTVAPHGLIDGYVVSIAGGTGNTGVNGTWKVTVLNSTQFTLYGSYGNGTYAANSATMTSGFRYASGLVADGYGASINFGAGAFFEVAIPIAKKQVQVADVGRMLVMKSDLFPTKNNGVFKISSINAGNTTTIASASNGATLPQSTINVVSTTGFPTSGIIYITTGTTIAVGSNGAILPQSTINVASTSGFPSSGTILVVTSAGTQVVSYTNTTATTFTGCTGGTGTMTTGGVVTSATAAPQTINYTNTTGTSFTGCTGGTGTLATGAGVSNLNRYLIDYRSTENPPAETSTIDWWLYETETVASGYLAKFAGARFGSGYNVITSTNASPIVIETDGGFPNTWFTGQQVTVSGHLTNTAANGTWTITKVDATKFSLNGSTGNGVGIATGTVALVGYAGGYTIPSNSRAIYQSPHASAWQVRLCAEPVLNNLPAMSITVGYGGTSAGDFPPGSNMSNVVLYTNVNPSVTTSYTNTIVGAGSTTNTSRMTIVGENSGQYVFTYHRSSAGNNGLIMFGIPDNEPVPTPSSPDRLFCYGSASTSDFGTIVIRTSTGLNVGNAMRLGNPPQLAAISGWANLDGTSATNPMSSANAGDSPFTSSTEILPLEVWGGINADMGLTNSAVPPFFYDQRFMGTAPILRNGRTNFTTFSLSSDDVTVRNVSAATNASPIQITTSTTNGLVSGQTVTIAGVLGNTAANGTWVVTVINNTQFTLNGSTGNGTYTSGGTATGCARFLHLQNGIYLQWNGPSGLTP